MLVGQAHWKTRENVYMEGDGRFWEDATAWPRLLLLRARDMSVLNLLHLQASLHFNNQSFCTIDQPNETAWP